MRINQIQQQNINQNFKGSLADKAVNTIVKNPKTMVALAGSSVVAQKFIMSGSEAVIGPFMDLGVGEVITKVTDEKDGKTKQNSRVQAIRTFAQSTGGTIVGIAMRLLCIGLATKACGKACENVAGKIGGQLNPEKYTKAEDLYRFKENAAKWGKSIGGFIATIVMLGTNFIFDVPLINAINTRTTKVIDKLFPPKNKEQKEVE